VSLQLPGDNISPQAGYQLIQRVRRVRVIKAIGANQLATIVRRYFEPFQWLGYLSPDDLRGNIGI
jgi:hypothetical protein